MRCISGSAPLSRPCLYTCPRPNAAVARVTSQYAASSRNLGTVLIHRNRQRTRHEPVKAITRDGPGVPFKELAFSEQPDACKLIHLVQPSANANRLIVYLPGTDGTGQSVCAQLPSLVQQRYDVWSLSLPVENRLGWTELTSSVATLLRTLDSEWRAAYNIAKPTIVLVGESFGGCLGLRVALEEPDLIQRLVLVNPATCYNDSLRGLTAFVSGTNLLGLFPQQLYAVAQETLLPLLVDSKRVTPTATELLKRMILMEEAPAMAATTATAATQRLVTSAAAQSAGSSSTYFTGGRAAGNGNGNDIGNGNGNGDRLPGLPTYGPAAAANFRVNLLRDGNLPNSKLQQLAVPTLIISAARDRLLPSIQEGARLVHLIPNSVRIILPDSGHAALLEKDVDLASLLNQGSTLTTEAVFARISKVEGPAASAPTAALPESKPPAAEPAGAKLRGPADPAPRALLEPKARSESYDGDRWTEMAQRLAPWRDLVSPVVLGAEHLPPVGSLDWSRPMLFVGNHGKMGFYDTPLLMYELFVRGYRVRGLAHPGHWKGPFGPVFESFGAVKASPMAAFRLLKTNQKVLLFPGGAREVVKKRGEEYQLLWKDSPDFVRLAAKCRAIIVPFAAVGADDAYDVIMETDEQLELPVVGNLVQNLIKQMDPELKPYESIFPLTRLPVLGLPSPIPVPNLTRLYFKFAPPVDTTHLNLDLNDEQQCQELYDGIRETINLDLASLKAMRDLDAERDVTARIRSSFSSWIPPILGSITEGIKTSDTSNNSMRT